MGRRNRCSLCGERLDKSLRCTVCGLDNTKNDDMYKHLINQNDCQDEPLSHVHEEPKINKNYGKVTYTYKKNSDTVRKSAKNSKKKGSTLGKIISAIIIFGSIVPVITAIIGNVAFGVGREEAIPEYILEDDFKFEYYLDPGFYEVGVHIPEGDYEVALIDDGYGWLDVYEFDGNTFVMKDCCSFDSEDDSRWILTLEEEDFVVISSDNSLSLRTSSDTYDMETGIDIGFEECYYIENSAVAWQDFPQGVYDIYYEQESEDEWGQVNIKIYDAWGREIMWESSLYFDGYIGENYFRNVPFTPGSQIIVEEGLSGITLVPSDIIGNEMYSITWGWGDIPVNE